MSGETPEDAIPGADQVALSVDGTTTAIEGVASAATTTLEKSVPASFAWISQIVGLFTRRNRKISANDESDALWDAIAEKVPFPMLRYDAKGRPKWNPAMEAATGYSEAEAIAHYETNPTDPYIMMRLLYRGDNLTKVINYLEEKRKTGRGYDRIAFTLTTKSGKEKTFIWITIPDGRGGDRRIGLPKEVMDICSPGTAKQPDNSNRNRDKTHPSAYDNAAFRSDLRALAITRSSRQFIVIRIPESTGKEQIRGFLNRFLGGITGASRLYYMGGDSFFLFISPDRPDLRAMMGFYQEKAQKDWGVDLKWSLGRLDAQFPGEHTEEEVIEELHKQVEVVCANGR